MSTSSNPSLLGRWLLLYGALAMAGVAWAAGVLATPASAPVKSARSAFAASASTTDPYRNFNFQVPMGNSGPRAGFTETTGLTPDGNASDYRTGAASAPGAPPKPRKSFKAVSPATTE